MWTKLNFINNVDKIKHVDNVDKIQVGHSLILATAGPLLLQLDLASFSFYYFFATKLIATFGKIAKWQNFA